MSKEKFLAENKRTREAATIGPWKYEQSDYVDEIVAPTKCCEFHESQWVAATSYDTLSCTVKNSENDAKFIVRAVNNSERTDKIIQILSEALNYLIDGEPDNNSGFACSFCDMGGSGYSSMGDGHHDDTRHICAVYKAQQALSHANEIAASMVEKDY